MNKNFFGAQPFFYLVTLIAMLVVVVVFGVKLVRTNQERDLVGQRIRTGEAEREALRKKIAQNESQINRYTEQISLQKEVELRERATGARVALRRVTQDQILQVSTGQSAGLFNPQPPVVQVQFGVSELAFAPAAPGQTTAWR